MKSFKMFSESELFNDCQSLQLLAETRLDDPKNQIYNAEYNLPDDDLPSDDDLIDRKKKWAVREVKKAIKYVLKTSPSNNKRL